MYSDYLFGLKTVDHLYFIAKLFNLTHAWQENQDISTFLHIKLFYKACCKCIAIGIDLGIVTIKVGIYFFKDVTGVKLFKERSNSVESFSLWDFKMTALFELITWT